MISIERLRKYGKESTASRAPLGLGDSDLIISECSALEAQQQSGSPSLMEEKKVCLTFTCTISTRSHAQEIPRSLPKYQISARAKRHSKAPNQTPQRYKYPSMQTRKPWKTAEQI